MREAEKACLSSWERKGATEEACFSNWASQAASNSGENQRKNERGGEQRGRSREGMVKILGIWVVLFVLTCDCFVVNLLGWICSLFCWFLVCVEDNNVIFGQWFCLESMYIRIYQKFCFWVKRMYRIFLIHLKLFFFFFAPTIPSFLKFWGPSSTWGP